MLSFLIFNDSGKIFSFQYVEVLLVNVLYNVKILVFELGMKIIQLLSDGIYCIYFDMFFVFVFIEQVFI